jgi:hypothetical protein
MVKNGQGALSRIMCMRIKNYLDIGKQIVGEATKNITGTCTDLLVDSGDPDWRSCFVALTLNLWTD